MSKNSLFDGFEAFRVPSEREVRAALQTGIVAVDTNVLLNLYRYAETTVEDLLQVLEKIGDRLFVPHQVTREFWRNRQNVLGNPTSAIKDTQAALSKNHSSTADAVTRWAKNVAADPQVKNEIMARVDLFFSDIKSRIGDGKPTRVSVSTPTDEDLLLVRIAHLLKGRIGAPLDPEEWTKCVAEGERRVDKMIPPGYMDVDKLESDLPEGASGDYLVWYELLREGMGQRRPLILVTSDTKEDWWNHPPGARPLGPRRELVQEYSDATGCRVFLLEPAELLSLSDSLGINTRSESVQDIERVKNEPAENAPWTSDSVLAVIEELENQGHIQAVVIREAAGHGGRIPRERVYELDGRSGDQMLRGFTRPVRRVTSELQALGVVPEGVSPLLRAVYETGVKSSHFVIPPEAIEVLVSGNGSAE